MTQIRLDKKPSDPELHAEHVQEEEDAHDEKRRARKYESNSTSVREDTNSYSTDSNQCKNDIGSIVISVLNPNSYSTNLKEPTSEAVKSRSCTDQTRDP